MIPTSGFEGIIDAGRIVAPLSEVPQSFPGCEAGSPQQSGPIGSGTPILNPDDLVAPTLDQPLLNPDDLAPKLEYQPMLQLDRSLPDNTLLMFGPGSMGSSGAI